MVTPGVAFLSRLTLNIFSRPLILVFVAHHASRRSGFQMPVWASVLAAGASLPLYIALRVWMKNHRDRAEAAALGARLAPRIVTKSVGNVDILKMMTHNRVHGYPGDGIKEMLAENGPIIDIPVLWADMIVTAWPDHIKQILATDFNNFEKGEGFRRMMSVLGSGVFNSDGEMWKFHRTMSRPFFNKDKISHFDVIDRQTEIVISIMKKRFQAGYSIDFQDLIGRFTMDTTTEFLFGSCVHSLRSNIPYAHNVTSPTPQAASAEDKFIDAFNEAMDVPTTRNWRGQFWPLWEIWKDNSAAPMKIVDSFLDPIIRTAMERKRTAAEWKGEGEADTLLDELLNSTSDLRILKDETLNILLAGRDTTMHTLTMVLYFLSMYPQVCDRLRAEVLAHVGPSRRPTYEDLKPMKYLRAVINESLRLYPPLPNNQRVSVKPTLWSSPDPNQKPIYIPAGTRCMFSVFQMHHRPDIWGADAEEFSPDRFLDEPAKDYNAFQFLPFNGGPRICLGQQFAYNIMSFVLIRLLQTFPSFKLDEAAFPPETRPPAAWKAAPGRKGIERFRPKMHITMFSLGGMWIRAKDTVEHAD